MKRIALVALMLSGCSMVVRPPAEPRSKDDCTLAPAIVDAALTAAMVSAAADSYTQNDPGLQTTTIVAASILALSTVAGLAQTSSCRSRAQAQ